MKTRSLLTVAALLGALAAAPAHAAVPTDSASDSVTVRPGQLDRGAGPAVPATVGGTIVDGPLTVRVAGATELQMLGRSGDGWLAVVYDASGSRVERVLPDGSRSVLTERAGGDLDLASDGGTLLQTTVHRGRVTRLLGRDTTTGERTLLLRVGSVMTVHDVDDRRALVSTEGEGTSLLDLTDGSRREISERDAYWADLDTGLLAVLTSNEIGEGCSRLRTLEGDPVWHSCERGVLDVSDDGTRIATTALHGDGPLSELLIHDGAGTPILRYALAGTWTLGGTEFEDGDSWVMRSYGERRQTLVRCTEGDCERASGYEQNPW